MTLDLERPRIVLVDDPPDGLESFALLRRASGYSVPTAVDGGAAVQVPEALCPDVRIIDLSRPKLDGYALARGVRHQPWGTRAQLIALTGWGPETHRERT